MELVIGVNPDQTTQLIFYRSATSFESRALSPDKADGGGGGGRLLSLFFLLKNFGSIFQTRGRGILLHHQPL